MITITNKTDCCGCGACAMAGKCHGGSACGGSALRDVKNLKHQNT